MATEPGPFDADPYMDKILDVAEDIGTPEALGAADEMINKIDQAPEQD